MVPLLEVENLKVNYGRIRALRGFSLKVDEGKAVAVLGSNGAGKTTLLKTISGLPQVASRSIEMKVEQGEIRFAGRKIDRELPETIVRLGIAHVPEGREIFPDLTVEENLKMGAYTRKGFAEGEIKRIYSHFPILAERRGMRAERLSGGEQQMLAIGRALMAQPRLLLLDEPSLGLAPLLVESVFAIIRRIKARGVTILLVEQNAWQALEIADRGYVMETGKIILADTADVLKANPEVETAYLGGAV